MGKKCSIQVQYSIDVFINEGECNLKMCFFFSELLFYMGLLVLLKMRTNFYSICCEPSSELCGQYILFQHQFC